ncbi:GspH/FimT family pseudopilin [Vreelandella olivaria]|uniref:GspH/FimT family pseudopilin n=1 Tax=Vreelandella olivaria TaxID=390919 RepID=UPI00201EAE8D|nr:GspH/FimT family pseudopilin [Halomonas olivaria]
MLSTYHSPASKGCTGFTLIELTIALLLIATLAAWGLPSFQAFGRNTAVISDVNRLQTAFSLARNTAITQRTTVSVCPTDSSRSACISDWSQDFMVLKGVTISPALNDDIVRIFPALPETTVSYSRGWQRVSYNPMGHTSGFNGRFEICAENAQGRTLILSQLGRLRIDDTPIRC